jgi:hypothetical protein
MLQHEIACACACGVLDLAYDGKSKPFVKRPCLKIEGVEKKPPFAMLPSEALGGFHKLATKALTTVPNPENGYVQPIPLEFTLNAPC